MSLISRRTFGKSLLASLGLAVFHPSSLVQAQLFGLFLGKGRETPAITSNEDFYVTSYDLTPEINLEQWSLHLGGMVKRPTSWSFADLLKRPQTKMIATLECIGNTVGGYSIGTAEWEGVKLNHLLDEAGFDPKAFDLVLRGADDYSDSFPLARALEDDVLLAVKMNGAPLPPDHGYPARVIVPVPGPISNALNSPGSPARSTNLATRLRSARKCWLSALRGVIECRRRRAAISDLVWLTARKCPWPVRWLTWPPPPYPYPRFAPAPHRSSSHSRVR